MAPKRYQYGPVASRGEVVDHAVMGRRGSPVSAVFWIALLIRVGYCLFAVAVMHKAAPGGPSHDGYVEIARSLAAGEGYRLAGEPNFFRPPAYVIFLLPWVVLPGTQYGIMLAQSVIGAATCALIARVIRSSSGNRNAFIGGLVLAVCPWHVHFTANGMTPVLAAFLTMALIWASGYSMGPRPVAWSGFTGAAFGALALCHPSSVLIGPTWLAWRTVVGFRRRDRASAITSCSLFVAAAAVVMSPWVIRNWRATGSFLPLSNSAGFQAFVADVMVRETPTPFSLPPTGIQSGMKEAREYLQRHGISPNLEVLSYKGVGMAEARLFDAWMREHFFSGATLGKRLFLQAWWFWFGDTPHATVLHLGFKGILMLLAVRAMIFGAYRNSLCVLCALVVLCYWSIHSIFMAYIPLAAYSLVAIGPLCVIAFSGTTARLDESAKDPVPAVS